MPTGLLLCGISYSLFGKLPALLEIPDELGHLDAKMHALYAVHTIVGILLFEVCRQNITAASESYYIGVLLRVEVEPHGDGVILYLRIHLKDLFFQGGQGIHG